MSIAAETASAAISREHHAYAMRSYRRAAKVLHWTVAVLIAFMTVSGVMMKQMMGATADLLFDLHKLAGVIVLTLILARVLYRVLRPDPSWRAGVHRRPWIHWLLYVLAILVPLLGWAGISDFGARAIFGAFSLPAIWPEGAGFSSWLFEIHAYLAFAMLAIVVLHIGIAMQDHITRSRNDSGDEHDER